MRRDDHGNTEVRKHGKRECVRFLPKPGRHSGFPFRDCIPFLLLLCASASWGQATVKQIDYHGWNGCWEISNPLVRVVVVPQIGGRIMEYSLGGENALWQNVDELGKVTGDDLGKTWRNYGGYKAWNAPQSKWSTTNRDFHYDSAPAQVEPLADQSGVRVTTAPIGHLGYQLIREVVLSDSTSRVRITERMRNISNHDITWGVWDVTQVNAPCWIAFPLNANSSYPQGWNVLYPPGRPVQQIKRVGNIGIAQYDNRTEKWATDAMGGWMAYIKDQLAYTKHWSTRLVDVTYPDGGCDAAFYTCSKDYFGGYAEMQVMGPITKLAPGEESTLVEDWFLTRLNQSAKDESDVISRLKMLQIRGMLPRGLKL